MKSLFDLFFGVISRERKGRNARGKELLVLFLLFLLHPVFSQAIGGTFLPLPKRNTIGFCALPY